MHVNAKPEPGAKLPEFLNPGLSLMPKVKVPALVQRANRKRAHKNPLDKLLRR
jgi:hypothetical protein